MTLDFLAASTFKFLANRWIARSRSSKPALGLSGPEHPPSASRLARSIRDARCWPRSNEGRSQGVDDLFQQCRL